MNNVFTEFLMSSYSVQSERLLNLLSNFETRDPMFIDNLRELIMEDIDTKLKKKAPKT